MYEYKAKIIRVVDGDTMHAEVDVGFEVRIKMTLRLYGLNAPEVSTEQGKAVRQLVRDQLEGKDVMVHTLKDKREKYGRYLAVIHYLDGKGESFNDYLVNNGHAVRYYA